MTTILEKIKNSVEQGHYKVTEQLINQALKKHVPALRIVEESMVPAMRRMGEKYKNDEADIPKILSCARCMRKGLDLLTPYLETERGLGDHPEGKTAQDPSAGDHGAADRCILSPLYVSELECPVWRHQRSVESCKDVPPIWDDGGIYGGGKVHETDAAGGILGVGSGADH